MAPEVLVALNIFYKDSFQAWVLEFAVATHHFLSTSRGVQATMLRYFINFVYPPQCYSRMGEEIQHGKRDDAI